MVRPGSHCVVCEQTCFCILLSDARYCGSGCSGAGEAGDGDGSGDGSGKGDDDAETAAAGDGNGALGRGVFRFRTGVVVGVASFEEERDGARGEGSAASRRGVGWSLRIFMPVENADPCLV